VEAKAEPENTSAAVATKAAMNVCLFTKVPAPLRPGDPGRVC